MKNNNKFDILYTHLLEKTNKFNIYWQIVRTNAKNIKNIDDKIEYIKKFLISQPNIYNYDRVYNWVKTTQMAYKDNDIKNKFNEFIKYLENNKDLFFKNMNDTSNDLSDISTSDLIKVYTDLKKRKYNFQFNKTPVDHISFIGEIEKELDKRKNATQTI